MLVLNVSLPRASESDSSIFTAVVVLRMDFWSWLRFCGVASRTERPRPQYPAHRLGFEKGFQDVPEDAYRHS